jgi:hypothetical protein
MQTFLPYPSFAASAKVLDSVRLNKQIIECKQIVSVLLGESEGWKNHPAVRMWEGCTDALIHYGLCMYGEWQSRTGNKRTHVAGEYLVGKLNWNSIIEECEAPWWLGMPWIHQPHQSRLMHKGNVDVLKTRFGKARTQKLNYLNVRRDFANHLPKEWNQITPLQVTYINGLLDRIGYPNATAVNPYNFNIGPEHAYIWPDGDGYKTKPNGKWEEWKPGDILPVLT